MRTMTNEYKKRIRDFLSNYIYLTADGYGYDDEEVIRQGIRILVEEGIFDVKGLQKAMIRNNLVLVPIDFINKCVCG